jgi:uncharacterized membrane protein YedE/YeeE
MKISISSFISGLIFALGLGIAGMTRPQKIIAFLDIGGAWNPALIFVMGAAVIVFGVTYILIRKRNTPLFANEWHVPKSGPVSRSLIVGSLLFGIGWGLAGYCPGPAIVSLASFQTSSLIFVSSMIAGMLSFKIFDIKVKTK